jgi:hypothetical protein
MSGPGNVESLLREALSPVEPPADLASRVTSRLQSISDHAADELESWELAAMRDPRNWLRPALALLGGGAAGAGLVLLRLAPAPPPRRRERIGSDAAGDDAH